MHAQRVEAHVETLSSERPDELALVYGHRRWTFAQMRYEMERRASVLAAAGLREGEVAITAEPQTDDLVLSFLACARLGVPLCPLSPLLTNAELTGLSARVHASVSFTVDGLLRSSLAADRSLPIPLPGAASSGVAERSSAGANAVAVIRPTSGTTGASPKLVLMPHRELTWRLASPGWWDTRGGVVYLPMRSHFPVLDVSFTLCSASTLVIPHATLPVQIETEMQEHEATILSTVPAVLRLLLNQKSAPTTLALKVIKTASAMLPPDLKVAAERWYGVTVVQLYGSTEGGFALPPRSEGRPTTVLATLGEVFGYRLSTSRGMKRHAALRESCASRRLA